MRRSSSFMLLGAILAWTLYPTVVLGQIDYRVNRGDAGGSGRLLDQNPGLGTGRVNLAAPSFDGWQRSNALISGNLTGLGRFQAYSPVLSNNQFRVSLPSAGLSSFQSISVGIGELRANQPPNTSFYYGTQETVPDLGHIRRGLNAPGSSQLKTPYTEPFSATTPRMTGEPLPIPNPLDLRLDRGLDASNLGVMRQTKLFDAPTVGEAMGERLSPFDAAVGSSLFGIPPPNELTTSGLLWPRAGLERVQAHANSLEVDPLDAAAARVTAQAAGEAALEVESGFDTRMKHPFGTDERRTDVTSPSMAASGMELRGVPVTVPIGGSPTDAQPPRELGWDRFSDLSRVVELAEQRGVRLGVGILPDKKVGSADEDSSLYAQDIAEQVDAPDQAPYDRDRSVREMATAAQWAGDLLEDPITSFAGRYRNQMNRYMEAGEAALRKGEYYDAARQFDLAHTVDPDNPLPLLHRGHALAAAGDYVSASLSLQKGIERFPQIAAFRINLPAMAGQSAVFDIRRADLESQLAIREFHEFRFLLGYLELYSDLPEAGLRDLERAAAEAPEGSVISLFVDLLLGRQEFPHVPPRK